MKDTVPKKYRLAFPINDVLGNGLPIVIFSIFLIIWGHGFIFPVIIFGLFASQISNLSSYYSTEYIISENILIIKSYSTEEKIPLIYEEISEYDLNYQDLRTYFKRTPFYFIDTKIYGEKVFLRATITKGKAIRIDSPSGVYILTPKEPENFFQDLCESAQKSVNQF